MLDNLSVSHAPSNSTLKLEWLPGSPATRHIITFDLEQAPENITLRDDLFRHEPPKNVTGRDFCSHLQNAETSGVCSTKKKRASNRRSGLPNNVFGNDIEQGPQIGLFETLCYLAHSNSRCAHVISLRPEAPCYQAIAITPPSTFAPQGPSYCRTLLVLLTKFPCRWSPMNSVARLAHSASCTETSAGLS